MGASEKLEMARQLHLANQLGEAEELYSQILSEDPVNGAALAGLGVLASQTGRHGIGLQLLDQAIALHSDSAEFYLDRGAVLAALGRVEDAIASYQRSIALNPRLPGAWSNLSGALYRMGQWDQAIDAARQAISLNPDLPEAHNNLAGILRKKGLLAESIESARKAIALRPDFGDAHQILGDILLAGGQWEESIASFARAIELNPVIAESHVGLGLALFKQRRVDEAINAYRAALKLRPDFTLAHVNLGIALMLKGDLNQGMAEYDWRWKLPEFSAVARRFSQPRWGGADLRGRRILLFAEQGIGDTLQFVRYVPLVAARGGRILLQCQPPLKNLLKNLRGVEQWIDEGPLPSFDVQCSLVTLPLIFGTTLQTIPAPVPYLTADEGLAQRWKQRIGGGRGRKIGLVWAGRPQYAEDRWRSIPLETLRPLWAAKNVSFFSLQKGPAADQIAKVSSEMNLTDLGNELHDFADTAAAMSAMDLIITVDTSPAHLAGALGRAVWVLLPYAADWRYFLDRSDSPWYPTMRLFRQMKPGDWETPIRTVATALG